MDANQESQGPVWSSVIAKSFALALIALISSCTHINIDDCPKGEIFGDNTIARFRSSHFRLELGNPPAAAARLLPYAAMSALAYRDGETCAPPDDNQLPNEARTKLLDVLRSTAGDGPAWERALELEPKDGCEDDRGLMLNVWHRVVGDRRDVVIAFRGTSGFRSSGLKDWYYGNLWWFTRWVAPDNQITRARAHAGAIIKHFANEGSQRSKELRIFTTGHSLGGSLAQHALYSFPKDVLQAIVFNPSAVTGFDDVSLEEQLEGCSCREELGAEARFLRVYESREILTHLRIFHKTFFPPERHVQEVRFPLNESRNPISDHAMVPLALALAETAGGNRVADPKAEWYASRDNKCTADFVEMQRKSCQIKATENRKCPS